MASFLDTWIDLKSREGTIEGLYSYWVLGRNASAKAPRWSIGKDVFHWTRLGGPTACSSRNSCLLSSRRSAANF